MKDKEISNFLEWLKRKSFIFRLWYGVIFLGNLISDFLRRKLNRFLIRFKKKEGLRNHSVNVNSNVTKLEYLHIGIPFRNEVPLDRISFKLATNNEITFDEIKRSSFSFQDEQDMHAAYRLRFLPVTINTIAEIPKKDFDVLGIWMEGCMYDQNFWHPYSVSERLVHLNWALLYIKNDEKDGPMLNAIYRQCKYLREHFEFKLGHHNHLINNSRALLNTATLLGDLPEATDWKKYAIKVFKAEWPYQVLPDGVHAEQSVTYHFLLTRTLWEMKYLMEQGGEQFPFDGDLNKMIHYARIITRPDGTIPFLGHLTPDWHWKELIGLLPVWGEDVVPLSDLGRLYKSQLNKGKTQDKNYPKVLLFPSAGQAIFRTEKMHAVLCCDPRGIVTVHGDQNLLGLDIWFCGTHLIRDAGLASYNLDTRREWYESWKGQSTFSIDGFNPIVSNWRKRQLPKDYYKITTTLQRDEGTSTIKASHTGYCRLPDPVTTYRSLNVGDESTIVIEDKLECNYQHTYHANFHFGDNKIQKQSDRRILITDKVNGNSFEFSWNNDMDFMIEENPFAVAYGEEFIGCTAVFKFNFSGHTRIEYTLKLI